MTQVSLKRDIKQFKEDVEKAVSKKLLQLHMKSTFRPLKAGNITYREEDKALESLAFLKEKCNGSVKGQACADGRKQRPWLSKEDATSPTVSLEAVLITSVIDAYGEIDVAIVEVPGSFLTDEQDETTNMTLRGKIA